MEGVLNFITARLSAETVKSDIYAVFPMRDNKKGLSVTMVKFRDAASRLQVYRRRTQLKGADDIWLNEDLIKPREALSYHARQLYRQKKIARNWTYGGEVYVKISDEDEPHKVQSLSELRSAAKLPVSYRFESNIKTPEKDSAIS